MKKYYTANKASNISKPHEGPDRRKYPRFDFVKFHQGLSARGYSIFTGTLVKDVLRIGNIGQLFDKEIDGLLVAVKEVLTEFDTKT